MMRTFLFAMALAFGAVDERLVMPMPDGFIVAHQQTAQTGTIEERVPQGETVRKWSRMITILKLNSAQSPISYATSFEETVTGACPGTRARHAPTRFAGRDAVDGRMDCPLNPDTGQPETFFYRALTSGSAIHMAQVAFRHVPSAREEAWARAQLDAATFCAAGSRTAACVR